VRERELRRWGNAWVLVALFGIALQFTDFGNWLANVLITLTSLVIANITWLRADLVETHR